MRESVDYARQFNRGDGYGNMQPQGMQLTKTTSVVKVGPIAFSINVNGDSPESIREWLRSLRSNHICIAKTDVMDEYEILGTLPFVQTIRLTMDDDADYQQICALRAQLRYR